jgi:hypothetical protein
MAALTATPAALKAAYPALYALSEKEIKAIIVNAMNMTAGLDLPIMLANSASYKTLAKKDMLVAMAAMIINQQLPTRTIAQWRDSSRCLACAPDKTIEAAFVYLFANYFQAKAL